MNIQKQETIVAVEMAALSLPFNEAVLYLETVLGTGPEMCTKHAVALALLHPNTMMGVTCVSVYCECERGEYSRGFKAPARGDQSYPCNAKVSEGIPG